MGIVAVHHPDYRIHWDPEHPLKMTKYGALADYLAQHSAVIPANRVCPKPATPSLLAKVHAHQYIEHFLNGTLTASELRRMGVIWSPALVKRVLSAAGGTCETVRQALHTGFAANTAGGAHHAHFDHGAGFCVFNDVAVGARLALDELDVSRVLILDCDVHQGDGTARLFAEDDRVFTCSMHSERLYPGRKANSDKDIELPPKIGDEAYLAILAEQVPMIVDALAPELIIYIAGVDVYENDNLGNFSISEQGILERERRILELAKVRSIPIAVVMGGGYLDDVNHLAYLHSLVFQAAVEHYA
ncbi:histone deacetylase [Pleionea sp. CnH1-48]|uniref:histone deacetylase family protein n=1 Tax=Pleionea sp. CnH1-48 TaxID=2954494 RepID=UPI0020973F9A|nr:histone deacetylase [Pleionea sp. CnH1-48]MCO7225679.1 histone deacetylase [Pleionea sp. CnH1-48]